MASFTIDADNNITAHTDVPNDDHLPTFASEKELAHIAAPWPTARLVEIWNSFAGVAPFEDLKPVQKFTSRNTAVRRIWQAVARLLPDVAAPARSVAPAKAKSKKAAGHSKQRARGRNSAAESRLNKKATVVGLMKRAKGATLAEIVESTGWQKHTVRGFISLLGSKGGAKIESTKNSAGDRTYKITK